MRQVPDDERPIPAGPLAIRVRNRGDKASLAKRIDETPQVITNWIKRGTVPRAKLRKICRGLGITEPTYRAEAGLPSLDTPTGQGQLDAGPLLRDFEALPPALRDYVANTTAELRAMVESVRKELRPLISAPPKDRARYADWEAGIKALTALRK